MYGFLNIGLEVAEPPPDEALLRSLAGTGTALVPATPGPSAHEDFITLAQVHRMLGIREPSRVIRNVLFRLQQAKPGDEGLGFVSQVLSRYFGIELQNIRFDEARDLELRVPVKEEAEYALDIVSSGAGLNQLLQLAAIIAWRRPGYVLLDEPDAHLHTSIQLSLFDLLKALVERFGLQVILSTHSREGAIHFALLGTRYWGGGGAGVSGRRGGLPADTPGVRRVVHVGEGLRRLPAAAPLAERLPVPGMRRGQGLGDHPRSTAVFRVSASDLGGRGDHLRGHAEATANLV
jgi:hypothetical protein